MIVEVKAIACELPAMLGVPFSRLSVSDIRDVAMERGVVAGISGTTIWRWLSADAIRPWCHRSWIFPRDPDFEAKAGRVLDLYALRQGGTRSAGILSSHGTTSTSSNAHADVAAPDGRLRRRRSGRDLRL